MSNTKHTPEPWQANTNHPWIIISTTQDAGFEHTLAYLSATECTPGKETCMANRDRIIACVNALAGIEDPKAFMKIIIEIKDAWSDSNAYTNNYIINIVERLINFIPIQKQS